MGGARCCSSMFDILRQAAVDHIRSVYDVDATAQCTVVIRKCKSDDSDVYVTIGRPQEIDSYHQHLVMTACDIC